MSAKEDTGSRPSQPSDLRREAERRLRDKEAMPAQSMAQADARAVVHELQVHQIELKMQNEELQLAHAAAQEASEKYQDLFDFAPVGYFLWDHEGRILEANLAAAALLGLDRNAVIQKRFGQFVAMEDRVAFADFCKRVLTTDAKQTCEVELLRDGQAVHAMIEGIAVQDRQGQRVVCRAAVIDITDRKRASELASAKEVTEATNRAKDRFIAVLSHELRTPLTPIVLGVSMLQARHDLDSGIRETLETVRRNAEMEARLIDDLLDLSRIVSGKIEIRKQRVELCTIIRNAVDVCRPDIKARGLEFGVDLGPAAPYCVKADPDRLQQVFWNLLKNAIKFTPNGGCVGIRCRPDVQGHVVAEVNDSGIGIEADALPRLFNAFEQTDRSITRQFGGLGLGLAISKALVEMHGGTIEARSEGKGKGATFQVRLPMTASASQPEAPPSTAPVQHTFRPLHILLVEDHGVTAKIMRMVLTEDGHTVAMAGDIATGLELASQNRFDLLISDLGLPDGSGHELMRQLRSRGHKFPGIAMSGYGLKEDIQRSYEAGFAAHLTKPASRESVIEAVASVTAK